MDKALVKFVGAGLSTVVIGLGRKVPVGAIASGHYLISHLLETNPAETRHIIEGVVKEIFVDWKKSGVPMSVADTHLEALPQVLDQHRVAQNILVGGLAVAKKSAKEGRRAVTVPARRIAAEFVTLARESQSLSRAKLADAVTFFLVERTFAHLLMERHTLIGLTTPLNTYFMKSMWMGPSANSQSDAGDQHDDASRSEGGPAVTENEMAPLRPLSVPTHLAVPNRSDVRMPTASFGRDREPPMFGSDDAPRSVAFKPMALPQQERSLFSGAAVPRERALPAAPAGVQPSALPPYRDAVSDDVVFGSTQQPGPALAAIDTYPQPRDGFSMELPLPVDVPRDEIQPFELPPMDLSAFDLPEPAVPEASVAAKPAVLSSTYAAADIDLEALVALEASLAPWPEPNAAVVPVAPNTVALQPQAPVEALPPMWNNEIPPGPYSVAEPGPIDPQQLAELAVVVPELPRISGPTRVRRIRKIVVAPTHFGTPSDAVFAATTAGEPAALPIATAGSAFDAELASLDDVIEQHFTDAGRTTPETDATVSLALEEPDPAPVQMTVAVEDIPHGESVVQEQPLAPTHAAETRAHLPFPPYGSDDDELLERELDLFELENFCLDVTDDRPGPDRANDQDRTDATADGAVAEAMATADAARGVELEAVVETAPAMPPDAPMTLTAVVAADDWSTVADTVTSPVRLAGEQPAPAAAWTDSSDTVLAPEPAEAFVATTVPAPIPLPVATDTAATAVPVSAAPETPADKPAGLRFDQPSSTVMGIVRTGGGEITIPTACAVEFELRQTGSATSDAVKSGCKLIISIMQRLAVRINEADESADACGLALEALRSGRFDDTRSSLSRAEAATMLEAQDGGDMARTALRGAVELRIIHADLEVACGRSAVAAAHLAEAGRAVPAEDRTRRWSLAIRRARLLARVLPGAGNDAAATEPLALVLAAYRAALAIITDQDETQDYGRAQGEFAVLLNRSGRVHGRIDELNEAASFIDQTIDTLARCRAMDDWAEAHVQRGVVYLQLANFEEPREHLERAINSFNCALGQISAQRSLVAWSEARAWLGLALKHMARSTRDASWLAEGVTHLRAVCDAENIDLSRTGLTLGDIALELGDAINTLSAQRNEPGLHATAVSAIARVIGRCEIEPGHDVALLGLLYDRLGDGLWQLGGHRQDVELLEKASRAMERGIELLLQAGEEARAEERISELERLHDYRASLIEHLQSRDSRLEIRIA